MHRVVRLDSSSYNSLCTYTDVPYLDLDQEDFDLSYEQEDFDSVFFTLIDFLFFTMNSNFSFSSLFENPNRCTMLIVYLKYEF